MSQPTSPAASSAATSLYRDCQSADQSIQSSAYRTLWRLLYQSAWQLVHNQADASDLAEDCAQQALIRIHQRLHECNQPAAFFSWAQRIVTNLTIDELRRRKRFSTPAHASAPNPVEQIAFTPTTLAALEIDELRNLLEQAPISDRSRRVVVGRFFEESDDERLAAIEAELSGEAVLNSHIQVTRAKNLAKLRTWQPLRAYLQGEERTESFYSS